MATIKIDPQTTKEIIKDITTSKLSAFQLGHKYKLSKMTIDRIGREHLGTDTYSRREQLAFASLCTQITELRSRNYSLTAIAEQLGIPRSSIFEISKKIMAQTFEKVASADNNEVQVISIESKVDEASKLSAGHTTTLVAKEEHADCTTTPVVKEEHDAKAVSLNTKTYHRRYPKRNGHTPNRTRQGLKNRIPHGYIKITFNDIQITFNPAQREAEDVITWLLSGINS